MQKFSRFHRILIASGSILLIIGGMLSFWLLNRPEQSHAANNLPYNMTADGPYHVQGNTIIDAQGQPYIFHGLGRDGLEFSCTGDGPLDAAHLALMGPGPTSSANGTYWWGNTVRLPLSEDFWLHGATGYTCPASQYQALVKQIVDTLTSLHLNVILDLQWVDAGGQSREGGGPWAMPDADSVTFWTQVATTYSAYSNVLFELYNEPHPATWACWQAGCTVTDKDYSNDCQCQETLTYPGVGMQALVNAVRGTGATNLVIVGGTNWSYDLSQLGAYPITGSNLMYDTHPYPYPGKMPAQWDASFGNVSATVPVISDESGEYDCQTSFESQLLSYFDAHNISWMGWAWTVQGSASVCTYPQVITDYQGTPAPSMGQLEYQHLLSYVPAGTQPPPVPTVTSTGTPTLPAGPTSKTWYFAEGRVGKGFREYLTLENPSGNVCAANIQYNYTPDNGQPANKTVAVTIRPYSRLTESVNNDLGFVDLGTAAATVATVVSVNTAQSGYCSGIVAERPMYFVHFQGRISSGTDVLGSTHLSNTYYFADVPGGPNFTSYLTILNPNNASATVTVQYYANGNMVGQQSTTVPANARGTIAPGAISLPTHVAAIVTSNQQIMVERPTYFTGVAVNGTTVSGAYDIVGVPTLTNNWFFAEGYTGSSTQEYLTIANLNAQATATVNISLFAQTGTTKTDTITIAPNSQTIWNVNANNSFSGSTPEVSVQVTSSGANIIVQREEYFTYKHTLTNGRTTSAMGGTDVIGQPGSTTYSAYDFAEGYANTGYNAWLTLQNPTANAETIYVTLVNGYGQTHVHTFTVGAHSRFTEDIASLVQTDFNAGTDSQANSFSMTVQTLNNGGAFVAERPMYFNTSGSSFPVQGGTDIIGYVGN
jgi:endoglucanase